MKLSEAFQYQNYLERIFYKADAFLRDSKNAVEVIQQHLRSKANPDAADETIIDEVERSCNCTMDDMLDFAIAVIQERYDVSRAISIAKASADFSIDAEQMANRFRHSLSGSLRSTVDSFREGERYAANAGTGYKFNADGEQMPYRYDIVSKTHLLFDRARMKDAAKQLLLKANEVSLEIDRRITEIDVEHTPIFCVVDSFEDAVETFLRQRLEKGADA